MAKKIFRGIGKVLGIGKKKAEPAAPTPEEKKGPIITQLDGGPASILDPRRRNRRAGAGPANPTILADKLGSY